MNASPPNSATTRRARWLAGGILVLATFAAYQNSFGGPFVFDDGPAIAENPSIRRLWPLSGVLAPGLDGGLTVSGRPLVNVSLAINYALGGDTVWGYHLFNLLIHVLAGLTLFGVVRRIFAETVGRGHRTPPNSTGRRDQAIPPYRVDADALAFFTALLWLLHPLQTESVTYVVQRAESLMGLCYLMTLYGFIGVGSGQAAFARTNR